MTKPKDSAPAPTTGAAPANTAAANSLSKSNKEIKKLLDMGVQRGFLTFVEVNELLPPEIIAPTAIDAACGGMSNAIN